MSLADSSRRPTTRKTSEEEEARAAACYNWADAKARPTALLCSRLASAAAAAARAAPFVWPPPERRILFSFLVGARKHELVFGACKLLSARLAALAALAAAS